MNSWQSPVAGEPSLGTLHPLTNWTEKPVDGVDPTTTVLQTIDCTSYVPNGCRAVHVRCAMVASTAGRGLWIRDPDNLKTTVNCMNTSTTIESTADGIGYLDASRNLYWKVDNTDVTSVSIWLTGYYI